VRQINFKDVPIEVRVVEPGRVGIDRLLGALAVNHLRGPLRAAISVDMGTAITINLINPNGAFEGGAILPGPGIALAALHAATASLPKLPPPDLAVRCSPIGKTTEEAMQSGAYWGSLGAIRCLTALMAADNMGAGDWQYPDLFITGGGSQHYARLLQHFEQQFRHVPHLVLAGIRLVAEGLPAP
jgi:type III pantothenate kinase